jgi:hypothetical protein
MKKCSKCKTEKQATPEFFCRNKGRPDGWHCWCKECLYASQKKHRHKNREKIAANNKEWRENNPEWVRAYHKKYHQKNRKKKAANNKKWRQDNREKIKKYLQNNREERLTQKRKYYHNNRERIQAEAREYSRNNHEKRNAQRRHRRQIDPMYKLQSNMRSGFSRVLSKRSTSKSCRTFDYIGMTPEGFWQYLESQFQPGMTRENYGEWHVDHIRPVSSFDFEGDNLEAALHECWHYTNLRPLWAKDNISKGAKYEPEEH